MGTPTLVVVSGPMGSGKTTLAHALAARIGCPAICRDELKEGMVASNPGFVASTSDPLTMRTYGLFFAAIELLLRHEVTLVAEAAFQHRLWAQGLEPLLDLATVRVVSCRVSPTEARRRAVHRMQDQTTRSAHADADALALGPVEFDAIRLDVPVLEVDTTDGYRPGLAETAAFARQQLG